MQATDEKRLLYKKAAHNAKAKLRPGDRIRVTACPGNKRWATFDHFEGDWVISRSGQIYHPANIDQVFDELVNFKESKL